MKYQSIYNRVRRIEGQIRGVGEMVAGDKPEEEILIQLEAVRSSVASTISSLVESMVENGKNGDGSIKDQHLQTMLRLIKRG